MVALFTYGATDVICVLLCAVCISFVTLIPEASGDTVGCAFVLLDIFCKGVSAVVLTDLLVEFISDLIPSVLFELDINDCNFVPLSIPLFVIFDTIAFSFDEFEVALIVALE